MGNDLTHKLFSGVFTALVTPFKQGKVDYKSLEKLIEYQIEQGIRGLVLLGTTGESVTLDDDEHDTVLQQAIKRVGRRIPVVIGTGSNCTAKAIKLNRQAEELGADGVLMVTPYYNRPTQEGLFLHFEAIAKATSLPICLYSVPSRSGVELSVETVTRLQQSYSNVVAIKEAGGSCNRVSQLIKDTGASFNVLGGDDSLALPFFALGAHGLVSVATNWVVKPLVDMFQLSVDNNLEAASYINRQFYPLFRALTIETNPVPIKQVLYRAGLIETPEVRLPLSPLSDNSLTHINKVFESLHGVV